MKTPPLLLLLAFSFLITSATSSFADRESIPLDTGWLFVRTDADIMDSSDDWGKVSVPHTWNALDGQTGPKSVSDKLETASKAEKDAASRKAASTPTSDPHIFSGYYRGACWYEHKLEIPAEWKGKKRVFIRFGAAGTVARTYINKSFLGEHRGGFTAFCYELTDYLNYGGTNELRVQVDNTHREDLAPLSGDFNVDGGLYRSVGLIVTDEVCISPIHYASPGVFLTTASLTDKQAVVEVKTIISNGIKPKKTTEPDAVKPGVTITVEPEDTRNPPTTPVTVQTDIKDATGKTVASQSNVNELPMDRTGSVTQVLTIPDPHRWNGRKDPYLYTATVSLVLDNKTVDQVTQPLGLRTVAITQEQGFLLNGVPYPIHGVNRHQDMRSKGWAISPEDQERDAALMKELGVTAVRNTHYPHDENWHTINDREGVLVWDEITQVDTTRPTHAYWLNSEEYLNEMVRQLYNHPSIAWWGLFNELGNKPMSPCDQELEHLQSVAKGLDPHRIIVSASCRKNRSFNWITDQIGFNTYPGWYGSAPDTGMTDYIDGRSKEVGKRIAISEYGAGANIAHHTEGDPVKPDTKGAFHPEEWQSHVHELDWARMKDNPKLWGTFVWCMFDFACKRRDEGNTPALNDKGLVTHDRQFKKDAFYFYKANWNPEPMVYITSRRSTPRTQRVTDVKIYSNCAEVELKVNGKSYGKVKPDSVNIAQWKGVKLRSGVNTIDATTKSGDKSLSDSCKWDLVPKEGTE